MNHWSYSLLAAFGVVVYSAEASARICETCDPGGPTIPGGAVDPRNICGQVHTPTFDDLVLVGASGWNCAQSSINAWWGGYHYDVGDWDTWGYYAACDPTYPLAGAFNA